MSEIDRIQSNYVSIDQLADYVHSSRISSQKQNVESFQDVFLATTRQKVQEKAADREMEVRFSKHANERLESRNINLSKEQMLRLNQGVNRARGKSINESLVMLDDLAFIVNVKNNTVVTAVEQNDDSVFTNIDGAVIV